MKYYRIMIKTITEAEDILTAELYDHGFEGALIEDHVPLTPLEKEKMFVDIPPETGEDDGVAYVSFFLEENDGKGESGGVGLSGAEDNSYALVSNGETRTIDEAVAEVKEVLEEISSYCDIGEGEITVSETEDKDWLNNWKSFFKQFVVEDILILPSWEEPKEEYKDKKILRIDPGTAFGTGMHETTQLCIKALKPYINEETRFLDIGTGSGILAIAAFFYGLEKGAGTDLDINAVPAVSDNLRNNGIDENRFDLHIGNIITDKELQDLFAKENLNLITANIIAEVLVPLIPVAYDLLEKDGTLILSGILNEKATMITDAGKAAGFIVKEVSQKNEWSCVILTK